MEWSKTLSVVEFSGLGTLAPRAGSRLIHSFHGWARVLRSLKPRLKSTITRSSLFMKIVLISTYELGRQPFGLASPAAWLRRAGAKVTCLDTAVQRLPRAPVQEADLIAFYVPMHTATRKAIRLLEHVRRINSHAPLCFYGLYAPVNASFLRRLGADAILGGEFEQGLVQWVEKWSSAERVQRNDDSGASMVNLKRQQFIPPDRSGLPALEHYARLTLPDGQQRLAGYTEASRGCKHLCRHCPVVPVYQGQFRIVKPDMILADIAAQVEMGAQHITFGDPDFFNGVKHGLTVIQALHRNHPQLSYDVTIKIEHLLKYSHHLETLRRTGCLFVTSAVESIDDRVLRLLDKHHTQEDFLKVVRLLIPAGSRLLELTELQGLISEFDEQALSYRWSHPDPRMDALQARLLQFVNNAQCRGFTRQEIFASIWDLVHEVTPVHQIPRVPPRVSRAAIPYLNEPWYC